MEKLGAGLKRLEPGLNPKSVLASEKFSDPSVAGKQPGHHLTGVGEGMSAANVPLEIDQGEDWTTTIVYTDDLDMPHNVIAPCRLDIKSRTGQTQLSLSTPDVFVEGEIPEISLSSEIGLIQLHIEDDVTANMMPGSYQYDLFVTVNDGDEYVGNQVQRILYGTCTVGARVTVMS